MPKYVYSFELAFGFGFWFDQHTNKHEMHAGSKVWMYVIGCWLWQRSKWRRAPYMNRLDCCLWKLKFVNKWSFSRVCVFFAKNSFLTLLGPFSEAHCRCYRFSHPTQCSSMQPNSAQNNQTRFAETESRVHVCVCVCVYSVHIMEFIWMSFKVDKTW